MADSATPGLTRRTLLTGAAALLAATAATAAPRRAEAADLPQIRAAAAGWTGRRGELLVLTADPVTEADYALRLLEATEPDAPAELGPPLPIPLPADFHPHSMAALGSVLWVTGAVELDHDRARPALVRIEHAEGAYTQLPVPKAIRSGIATGVTPFGATGLAVVLEGCPDPHSAVVTRSHLAISTDAGRTWTQRRLASGLGEGFGTVLTGTGQGLFAATGDQDGTQTIHIGSKERIEAVATIPGTGRPMAAVAEADGVRVFSDRDGTVGLARYAGDGTPLGSAADESAADCACSGEIFAVPGSPGLWLETDGVKVHIRGSR
ncbi:hypothetical protein [Glycomyces harbinensis]|uniref:BNR repeat-like domain-containing protein n=1 Tax=Glycomyces harbinensis TaxID=58114 RepID=A0A1G6Y0Y5_9ACTN|nr:hypothetical protein [Glycomyces harbinensis]SDD84134.1 hypothetical protein SAMN05216270_10875 [Glycomyces harbinensis]